jgi:hypothetical protein
MENILFKFFCKKKKVLQLFVSASKWQCMREREKECEDD